MALEDQIRVSVDSAIDGLSARLQGEVRAIVERVVTMALGEPADSGPRAAAVTIWHDRAETERQNDGDAPLRASIDEAVARAREDERSKVVTEVRRLVEAEADRRVAEADAQAAERLEARVRDTRAHERDAEMEAVSRLLESIRALDSAQTLGDVLDALGDAAGREACRAAVLVVRNDRLTGWKSSGFGSYDSQPKRIDLGLTEEGVIASAVANARPTTTHDGHQEARGPGFADLPAERMGLALPIIVGGRVVSVLYADGVGDDARHTVPSPWPEVVEVLARHAGRCLEALTAQKVVAPMPRSVAGAAPRQTADAALPHSRPSADAASASWREGQPRNT
jgi:hypothetical protein